MITSLRPALILTLVVALSLLLHTAFGGSRIALSLFAINLGASPFTVGVVVALLALLPMAFSVAAGRLVGRIGVRKPMLAGAATVCAGIALIVISPRLETLFVASCLIGSGFVVFNIAVNYVAAVIGPPEDRARNFNSLGLGYSTSSFLGPMIAGFSIDWIGHRGAFLLLACIALVTLVGLVVKRIEVPLQPVDGHGAKKQRVGDLLRSGRMRHLLIVSGLLSMTWDVFSFTLPIHGSNYGLSASSIGLSIGAFGAAIFLVRLALPLVIHRVSEWQMLIGAMILCGIAMLLFPLANTVPRLIALGFVFGAGLACMQPIVLSLFYSWAPPGRGAEAIGVRMLLVNITQTVVPLLCGALGAVLGLTPVFWSMALLLLGGSYFLRKP